MIGALSASHLKGMRDPDHIPSPFRRIAVGVTPPGFGGWNFSASQLRLGVITGQSRFHHGCARVGFGIGFLFSGKGLFVQPGERVIEIVQVVGFPAVLFREQGIDLFVHRFRIEIGRRQTKSPREFRKRRNAVIGRKRHPDVCHADLMSQEVEELRQAPVEFERHAVHLRRVGTDPVPQNIVGRKADDQQVGGRSCAQLLV